MTEVCVCVLCMHYSVNYRLPQSSGYVFVKELKYV